MRLPAPGPETRHYYELAGLLEAYPDPYAHPVAPFRAPHYTVSAIGLVGCMGPRPMAFDRRGAACTAEGPRRFRPGEAHLAHGGILFLDELMEFRRSTLESLRYVLDDGGHYPARPVAVIATAMPCFCGHKGDTRVGARQCRCSVESLARYEARLTELAAILGLVRVDVTAPATFAEGNERIAGWSEGLPE